MTIYNKTTHDKVYGRDNFKVVVKASNVEGVRGPACDVPADSTMTALFLSQKEVLEDHAAGLIEIVAK